MPTTRTRAAALPAGERRAALIAATLPLVLRHGSGVTTRQIAEAAGIAEGTIFRVFPDKEALLQAVVEAVFDPTPAEQALRSVDISMPLEQRLEAAVDILQDRVTRIWQVMTAVGMIKPPDDRRQAANRRDSPEMQALAALFEPDRHRLRRDPVTSAQLLRGLTFAASHPALVLEEPATSAEIVSLLLDGIRRSPTDAAAVPSTVPSTTSAERPC